MMDVSQFKKEEDFKAWFFSERDPATQIRSLHAWRKHQQSIVGSFSNLVKLLASEQYAHSDHFLLELLQNADDNEYAQGLTPTLTITLTKTACIFECNERGFTAENVFAICYAAASTKKRQKSARTFIGEKGIGFKSLFAVAETVEIHSGDYHFELRDGEYVLPHLLSGPATIGSQIVVRFKQNLDGLAESVSKRLSLLSEKSRHFLLFLQQLECLTFIDEVAGNRRTVQVLRDRTTQRCLVASDGDPVGYHVESFTVEVPANIVKTRFEDLDGVLEREIVFAVPLPEDLPDGPPETGTLFCYLPTLQKTGLPIHIQVDAKTVTSREDIVDAQTSAWNRFMLQQVETHLVELFRRLVKLDDFRSSLPRYLPVIPTAPDSGNADLRGAVAAFCNRLKTEAVVLDRHNEFRPPSNVFSAPDSFQKWLETDQYEPLLNQFQPQKAEMPAADSTFLHPSWRQYRGLLKFLGSKELAGGELAVLWSKGAVPAVVLRGEDRQRREFLESVMHYGRSGVVPKSALREWPVHPLRSQDRSFWGPLAPEVMLVVSEVQNPTIPDDVTIVETAFTMVPSSTSRQNEEIRDFNNRYRDFIAGTLEVQRYSDADYLEQIVVRRMQQPSQGEWDRSKLLELSLRWVELYYRIWRRQKTIEDDSKKQWTQLITAIRGCHIPIARRDSEQTVHTVPVREAFLPERLGGLAGLQEALSPVGGPFIELLIEDASDLYWSNQARRRETEVDLQDWSAFLTSVGAHSGPYLIRPTPPQLFNATAEPCAGEFLQQVKQQIPGSENKAFAWEHEGIQTLALDAYTSRALRKRKDRPEVLTRGLATLWPSIRDGTTEVAYNLGARRSAARKTLLLNLAKAQIEGIPFIVRTLNDIEVRAEDSFLPTVENQMIAAGVVPLVDSQRYGNDTEFLLRLGVQGTISATSIIQLIDRTFRDGRLFRTWENFGPYLELVVRHLQRSKIDALRLKTSRIFLDPESEKLVDYQNWLDRGCDAQCPESLRSRLEQVFGDAETVSIDILLAQLREIGNPGTWNQELNAWFLRAAPLFIKGEGEELVHRFHRLVCDEGVVIHGDSCRAVNDLPAIWNCRPIPSSIMGLILPSERNEEASAAVGVARRLGWPLVSEIQTTPEPEVSLELDAKVWRVLDLTLQEVIRLFKQSHPGEAQRIEDLPFCKGSDSLQKNLKVARSLVLRLHNRDERLPVPFWKSHGCYTIGIGSRDLISAVAELIDTECGVTVAPFMKMISEKMEPHALEADPSRHQDSTNLPKGGVYNPTPSGSGAPSAEEILLGPEVAPESDSAQKKADNPPGNVNEDSVRKRLCSFVATGSTKNTSPEQKEQGKKKQKKNEETERAGAQLLQRFFKGRGLECRSVEDDNVGYDFEVRIGGRTLYIELKTSRDKWRGWEHSLSPNEFKTALAKGDDYFLCVIDRIFEADREIYFIQNPAGKITDYLFDAPWKAVAAKMEDWITRLKAEENILAE